MGKGSGVCEREALVVEGGSKAAIDKELKAKLLAPHGIPKEFSTASDNNYPVTNLSGQLKLSEAKIRKALEGLYQEGYLNRRKIQLVGMDAKAQTQRENYKLSELGEEARSDYILKELDLVSKDILGVLPEIQNPNQREVADKLGLGAKMTSQGFKELIAKNLVNKNQSWQGVRYELTERGENCRKLMLKNANFSPWTTEDPEAESQSLKGYKEIPSPLLSTTTSPTREELNLFAETFKGYNRQFQLTPTATKLQVEAEELEAKLDSYVKKGYLSKHLDLEIANYQGKPSLVKKEVRYTAVYAKKPEFLKELKEEFSKHLEEVDLEILTKLPASSNYYGKDLKELMSELGTEDNKLLPELIKLQQKGYLNISLRLSDEVKALES